MNGGGGAMARDGFSAHPSPRSATGIPYDGVSAAFLEQTGFRRTSCVRLMTEMLLVVQVSIDVAGRLPLSQAHAAPSFLTRCTPLPNER